ncbi:transcriptional regulator [Sphingomonas sp. 3-13AW]|uniref:3'-5' exonuclease n=1 Tax=Sphingomonas sp. 3-13AW TaxID=3050450 RepID=UPI003BB77CCC
MNVFLDFEASSLDSDSYPIEVAWVFQDGRSESHLIAPAPHWTDWDPASEAIHGIRRQTLIDEGETHEFVANRMVEVLDGHDLFASAPSWDGKWMSALLRGAGLARDALRLRDTDDALRETATDILKPYFPPTRLPVAVHNLIASVDVGSDGPPAHRALADATAEYEKWRAVRTAARELIATL